MQVGFIACRFHHISATWGNADIVLRAFHFQMVGRKVSINHDASGIQPAKVEESVKKWWIIIITHLRLSFSQSSGRFTPGWGQAGQKMAKAPGSTTPSAVWPYPACILAMMSLQALDVRISSRYRFWELIRKMNVQKYLLDAQVQNVD